jgi:hypothetical protein
MSGVGGLSSFTLMNKTTAHHQTSAHNQSTSSAYPLSKKYIKLSSHKRVDSVNNGGVPSGFVPHTSTNGG